jgi:hypothetical protein
VVDAFPRRFPQSGLPTRVARLRGLFEWRMIRPKSTTPMGGRPANVVSVEDVVGGNVAARWVRGAVLTIHGFNPIAVTSKWREGFSIPAPCGETPGLRRCDNPWLLQEPRTLSSPRDSVLRPWNR